MADQLSPSNRSKDAAQKAAKGRISNARSLNRDPMEWAREIRQGNRTALSQAITLTESANPPDQLMLDHLLQAIAPASAKKNSIRIGITGVPGVGKSTFIECYGQRLIDQGYRVAVLAVDPSSGISKGSLLGDKTRMELLSKESNAYIRPSPTSSALGGITRGTHEAILLCEAAGFDRILIETVGVGQSETSVYEMVDYFLLLKLAGAGDELQGIKRGIIEMADSIIINKSDGDNISAANQAQSEFSLALSLYPVKLSKWKPKVTTCSSINNNGIEEIWKDICDYFKLTKKNGYFLKNRNNQKKNWLMQTINNRIQDDFYNDSKKVIEIDNQIELLKKNKTTVLAAVEKIIKNGT